MHQLVPEFILRQQESKLTQGSFTGIALLVDISGFTALTEALLYKERADAEVLAALITGIFAPLQKIIHACGGFITNFVGDAFVAVFPEIHGECPGRALQAAARIRVLAAQNGSLETQVGTFELRVRMGMAYGPIEWGILNGSKQSIYYFRGDAIENSGRAENHAAPGELLITSELMNLVSNSVDVQPKGDYYTITRFHSAALPNPSLPKAFNERKTAHPEILSRFFPNELTFTSRRGEFRPVVSVFLNIAENPIHAKLQEFTSRFLSVLELYGGYLCRLDFGEKGCRLLLFWGAPHSTERDLERALNFILLAKNESPFPIRAGVSYGMAYAGFVGANLLEEYTCYSSRVNLAARLMSIAPWGEIWLGPECARRACHLFHIQPAGEHVLKGFSQPQPAMRLMGILAHHERPFQGQMVGRADTLLHLREAIQPIFSNRFAGAGYLYGEAGQGKSRLAYELCCQLGNSVTWLEAQAAELVRTPFNPFIQILSRYFNQESSAPEATRREAFEQAYRSLLQRLPEANNLRPELVRTRSILAAFVGLQEQESLWEQLDAKDRYENTLHAIRTLFLAESRTRPLVLFLDDSQWLDDDSRNLLTVLIRNAEEYPLVVLAALRYTDDGERPDLGLEGIPAFSLDLTALDAENIRAMAQAQLGAAVSGSVWERLVEKTSGNPFFIEQMLLDLQERQLLTFTGEAWDFIPGPIAEVPDDINAVLIARIDRLSAEVQDVVKTAAVLGREFEVQVLSQMLARSEMGDHLGELVHTAEKQGIWLAQLQKLQYIFKHALLRDAAYGMQLSARRQALHGLALEALENVYGANLSSHYADLAFHARYAANEERLRKYLRLAGEQAAGEYKNAAALEYFRQLIPLLSDGVDLANVQLELGSVLEFMGRWQEAESEYTAVREHATRTGNRDAVARSQKSLGNLFQKLGDFATALECLEQAIAGFRAQGDRQSEAETLGLQGNTYGRKGEFDASLRCLNECIALWRELDNQNGVANALHNLGNVAWSRGEYPAAKSHYEESLALRQAAGDKWAVATSLNNLGSLALNQGDYGTARELYEQSLSIRLEQGDMPGVASVRDNLGIVVWNQGDFRAAQQLHEQALAYRREIGDRPGIATTLCNLGNVFWQKNEPESARACFEESLSLRRSMGNKRGIAMALDALALHQGIIGDMPNALLSCREALQIRHSIGDRQGCAYSLLVMANLAGHTQPEHAAWLAAAAAHTFADLNAGIQKYYLQVQDQTISSCRAALGEDEFQHQWEAGNTSTLGKAVEYALEQVKS